MAETLDELESKKVTLLRRISRLGDFRPGSITTTTGRCGNPHCHCHQPANPGHGPNFRLTYKADGKTVTESFPSPAARRKAEQQVGEYRHWQQLSREFVEVNTAICRQRPLPADEEDRTAQEKKRPKRSTRKSRGK